MEKRTLLAIVLSFLVILIWQLLFTPKPMKPVKGKGEKTEEQAPVLPPKGEKIVQQPATEEAPLPKQVEKAELIKPSKEIVVTTPLYTALFTTNGARLKSLKLHHYRNQIEEPEAIRFFKRMFSEKEGKELKPATSPEVFQELIPPSPEESLPLQVEFQGEKEQLLSLVNFKVNADSLRLDKNNPQGEIIFSGVSPSGIKILKRFTFYWDQYPIGFDVSILNPTPEDITGEAKVEWIHPFDLLTQGGKSSFFSTPPNLYSFVYFVNENVVKNVLKDIKEEKVFSGNIKWAGFEDRYFISSFIPQEGKGIELKLSKPSESAILATMVHPQLTVPPQGGEYLHYRLYLGPKDLSILEAQKVGLEKTMNFGWFDIVAKPLLVSLKFFNRYVKNYGVAIIILTILIKILFWPLTHTSYKSMKDMQKIQPEITKLREKYKDNKEELNKKIMELYRTHKVNPLGGCLPLILQIPVFFALYKVLLDSIELRHAPFISFWINDLSGKDPTYISPLLMGASMFIQQKMTPTTGDPAQAKMMLFMPVIFTFMFLNFPSGLVIYWLVNNVLSIGQQIYINKRIS
jgi:YidC/Oxa1 family membrane protein insertase